MEQARAWWWCALLLARELVTPDFQRGCGRHVVHGIDCSMRHVVERRDVNQGFCNRSLLLLGVEF
jgi:hypothetical protein